MAVIVYDQRFRISFIVLDEEIYLFWDENKNNLEELADQITAIKNGWGIF